MEQTMTSNIEGSPDYISLIKFAKRSYFIGGIFMLTSGFINGIFGALIILACAFLFRTKNWARVLFITVASLIVTLGALSLLSLDVLFDQTSELASKSGLNATYLLISVLLVRILISAYFIYGICFLLRPNIKNLFLTN